MISSQCAGQNHYKYVFRYISYISHRNDVKLAIVFLDLSSVIENLEVVVRS